MATPHIAAEMGDIAERVILPGDPLRAKFIAENFLENPVCYNNVRGMLGFTGTYKGKRVSVQGTGMGIPSIGIYAYELIHFFGCKRLIRTGTCGALIPKYKIRDVLIVQAAATDSGTQITRFGAGVTFPPVADFYLMTDAVNAAKGLDVEPKIATVFSTDLFYKGSEITDRLSKFGVASSEMECAELFTLGAEAGVQTLGLLTVSDQIYDGKETTAEERQLSFTTMMKIALDAI